MGNRFLRMKDHPRPSGLGIIRRTTKGISGAPSTTIEYRRYAAIICEMQFEKHCVHRAGPGIIGAKNRHLWTVLEFQVMPASNIHISGQKEVGK